MTQYSFIQEATWGDLGIHTPKPSMKERFQNMKSSIKNTANEFGVRDKTVKGAVLGAGIGATIGVGRGLIKSTDASERVSHWKAKLRNARNAEEEK